LKTRKYETLLIARPEFEKEQLKELVQRLQERIERHQGKLMEVSDWGLRKLAYPIRLRGEKFYYGRYLLLTYAGNGKVVKELEDYMKLIDDTFRFNSYMVSEEVPLFEQSEPVWREDVVPEIKPRDDGEGLEVVEPSKQRKLTRQEMYRPRMAEKPGAKEEGAEPKAAESQEVAPEPTALTEDAVAEKSPENPEVPENAKSE
jgi:small subunit ribosomal protein S6